MSPSRLQRVYKILTPAEWQLAQQTRSLQTELDQVDGFVHLSTAAQLAGTLHRFFVRSDRLVLAEICQNSISDQLRWEAPMPAGGRAGLFPHLYRDLRLEDVIQSWDIVRGAFHLPFEVIDQAENEAAASSC